MEYKIFQIPRPDLILYLHLPVALSQKLLKNKLAFKKRYAKGRKDVVEDNLMYMETSQKSALSIIQKSNNWVKIQCERAGAVKPREEIHQLIYDQVRKLSKSRK